jgi:glycosyltransferase involved in cell wall biosynthesis
MRVTHIVAHPPFREGTGTVCYFNARALQDLGCDVRAYATRYGDVNAPPDFYRFMPSWLSIGNAYLTPALLNMEKADILHLHYPFIFGSELTLLKSCLGRVPMVLTYHNDLIGGGIRRPAFWLYNRLNAPFILGRARKIVVTSFDYAATSIYADSIFSRRKAELVEIGNGVDVDVFRPNVASAFIRLRHALGGRDFVLLFVSSLDRSHARKGLGLLLETLATLKDPAIKLVVAGDGDMRPEYEQQAHGLGLNGRVTFAGRIPQDELPAYYAASDAVAIPSRPPEAFGVSLAQGMAAGKPVIGSDIPGVRTLVHDGEQGFLIPPGDGAALARRILILTNSPALRVRMGAAGRERILQHYTWKAAGKKLFEMYQQVLQ